MADVKVPKLLHKMSLASQKAWYKKQGMEMPSATKPAEGEGKSAAAAKKVKVAPRKAVEIKPGSIRAINQARQDAYKGRQPIGATGSGGHSVMAGSNMSTAKGIIAGIKAGYNPRVSLNPYEGLTAKEKKAMKSEEVEQVDEIVAETNYRRPSMREIDAALDAERKGNTEPANKLRDIMRAKKAAQAQSSKEWAAKRPAQKFPVYEPGRRYVGDSVELDGPVIDEVTKKEAEAVLGGPVKGKPKMPPGKQPAGYRYVRGLARKAMKAGQFDVPTARPQELDTRDLMDVHNALHIPRGSSSMDEEVGQQAGKYEVKKTHTEYNDREPEPEDEYQEMQGVRTTRYDIHHNGSKVGELEHEDYFGTIHGHLHGKDLPEISGYAGARYGAKPHEILHTFLNSKTGQKWASNLHKYQKEEVEQVEEKLTAADPASKWISDFVNSDNPKFEGKSKKERIQQALGAYYAAKRGTNEEAEQVDEGAASHHGVAIDNSRLDKPKNISGLARKHGGQHLYRDPHGSVYVFSNKDGAKSFKDVVGSAASHIKADQTRKIMKMKELGEDVEQIDEAKTKMTDAHKKIARQVHRDLKSDEPVSQAYGFRVRQTHNLIRKKYGSNWRALAGINEEVEQIDELKKSTLASYIPKAANRMAAASRLQGEFRATDADTTKDPFHHQVAQGNSFQTMADRFKASAMKKQKGIQRATARLAKEEAEGKTPKTDTEVSLARMHGNPKKITYGDIVKARIASAKKKVLNKD